MKSDRGAGQSYTGDQPRMSEKSIRQYAERTPGVTYQQKRLGSQKDQRSYRSYGRG